MTTKKYSLHLTIHSTTLRLLILALLALALGASAVLARGESLAGPPSEASLAVQSATGRHYYLTTGTVDGNEPLSACAAGYHMAALWEILDPSNLVYNTTLGYVDPIGDGGPPSNVLGWIRTGASPSIGTTPGGGNCADWSYTDGSGTVVKLASDWTVASNIVGPWQAYTVECNTLRRVWCAED